MTEKGHIDTPNTVGKARRERELAGKIGRVMEEKSRDADVARTAETISLLVKDPRYARYKQLLEEMLDLKRAALPRLALVTKDSDDYVRQSIAMSAEIRLLESIINIPELFLAELAEINKKNAAIASPGR